MKIDFKIDKLHKAKQFIVDNGYDVAFGARPLKRFIQNNVETLIAKYMLANDLAPNSTITVDVVNDEIVVK